MSKSYLELVFRHKLVLMLPIVIAFTAASLLVLQAPREYVTSASIWTDTRVPAETTVGTTGGQNPPSAGQAALLTQLLTTREFLRDVVEVSPLSDEYRRADQVEQNRILGEVGASAYVSTPGPQLLSLIVTRNKPDEATGIASAILEQFEVAGVDEATRRAKAQLEYDERRLEAAEDLAKESSNRAAQELYADAAESFNESTMNLAAVESSGLRIVDEPILAEPQARMKKVIFGAVGGLVAGLTLSILALILLMVRDRALRSEDDVLAAGFDLVGNVPAMAKPRRKDQVHPIREPAGR